MMKAPGRQMSYKRPTKVTQTQAICPYKDKLVDEILAKLEAEEKLREREERGRAKEAPV